jgi:hypothetical protein
VLTVGSDSCLREKIRQREMLSISFLGRWSVFLFVYLFVGAGKKVDLATPSITINNFSFLVREKAA